MAKKKVCSRKKQRDGSTAQAGQHVHTAPRDKYIYICTAALVRTGYFPLTYTFGNAGQNRVIARHHRSISVFQHAVSQLHRSSRGQVMVYNYEYIHRSHQERTCVRAQQSPLSMNAGLSNVTLGNLHLYTPQSRHVLLYDPRSTIHTHIYPSSSRAQPAVYPRSSAWNLEAKAWVSGLLPK